MDRLRRAADRAVRFAREHPLGIDVAFAVFIGANSVLGYLAADPSGSQREQDVLGLLVVLALTGLLTQRRRLPLGVMVATVPLEVLFWVADYPTNFDVFPILTLYAATAHSGGSRRRVWGWTAAAIAVYVAVALVGVFSPEEDLPAVACLGIVVICGTAAVVGELVHQRRLRVLRRPGRRLPLWAVLPRPARGLSRVSAP